MFDVKTRRRFGQNFLDEETSRQIAGDLPCSAQDSILEIGAGGGALTEWLLPKCAKLTAIEIDNFCIPKLQERFKGSKHFNLVHKNFLQFNMEEYARENPSSWIAGNLPYNMASAIIAHIMPSISKTKGCMFMTQAEVAQRIAARAKDKGYGSLSVFCACYANCRIIRYIEPEHFRPRPKVRSATILFEPLARPVCESESFFAFVRAAFSQKRKTLANSLSAAHPKERTLRALADMRLGENARAEELSLENFITIFKAICSF